MAYFNIDEIGRNSKRGDIRLPDQPLNSSLDAISSLNVTSYEYSRAEIGDVMIGWKVICSNNKSKVIESSYDADIQ